MSIIFALYEGTSGNPATTTDCVAYSNQLLTKGWEHVKEIPILADGNFSLVAITPMTQAVHPELCALTPELTIISCYHGHGKIDFALEDIKFHAATAE